MECFLGGGLGGASATLCGLAAPECVELLGLKRAWIPLKVNGFLWSLLERTFSSVLPVLPVCVALRGRGLPSVGTAGAALFLLTSDFPSLVLLCSFSLFSTFEL